VTGKFVVSAFAMLLLVFMTDFAKIALLPTTFDHPGNRRHEHRSFIMVSVVLVSRWSPRRSSSYDRLVAFGLASNNNALYTFSFLMLLYLPHSPSCPRASAAGSGDDAQ